MKSFEELELWKMARELRNDIYSLVKKLPADEKYRLTDQIVRSSRSVTANVAEGFGRFHFQENIQFCRQARGSLFETLDHLICGLDSGLINKEDFDKMKLKQQNCLKLLNGFILYLKNAKLKESAK